MGFRFHRSVKLLPGVRLNFSRSGLSTTVGMRGASVNFGRLGTYLNTGIPGSGLSWRTRIDRHAGEAESGEVPTVGGAFTLGLLAGVAPLAGRLVAYGIAGMFILILGVVGSNVGPSTVTTRTIKPYGSTAAFEPGSNARDTGFRNSQGAEPLPTTHNSDVASFASDPSPQAPGASAIQSRGSQTFDDSTVSTSLITTREEARRIQLRLIELGYLAGPADGIWGKRSRLALKAFRLVGQDSEMMTVSIPLPK
jgi:Protein of unknown function (DUF4236)/Putative peptidoglycan binding domain